MIKITIIRHGQASALSDNYDQLSKLGERQAATLGKHLAQLGFQFDSIYSGTLHRQQTTANIICDSASEHGRQYPTVQSFEAFNEIQFGKVYDDIRMHLYQNNEEIRELIIQLDQESNPKKSNLIIEKIVWAIFRMYISGEYQSELLQPWSIFRDKLRTELMTLINKTKPGQHIAIVTSGGPIIATCQMAFELSDQSAAEKQWEIYNCSVTQLTYDQQKLSIENFNSIEHLAHDSDLITKI